MSGVFQNRRRLLDADAGEPFDELNNRRAALEIVEERRDRNARPSEDTGAAESARITLDRRAATLITGHNGTAKSLVSSTATLTVPHAVITTTAALQ